MTTAAVCHYAYVNDQLYSEHSYVDTDITYVLTYSTATDWNWQRDADAQSHIQKNVQFIAVAAATVIITVVATTTTAITWALPVTVFTRQFV